MKAVLIEINQPDGHAGMNSPNMSACTCEEHTKSGYHLGNF